MNRSSDERMRMVQPVPQLREAVTAVVAPLAQERRAYQEKNAACHFRSTPLDSN